MINLYNLIPLYPISKRNNKEKEEKVKKIVDKVSEVETLIKLKNTILRNYELKKNITNELSNNGIVDQINNDRKEFFLDYGFLPKQIENSYLINSNGELVSSPHNHLTLLNQTPTTKGRDLKFLSDNFNFITIPFNCLNVDCYQNEDIMMRRAIRNFNLKNKDDFEIYVITPIEYYSVQNHVSNNSNDLPIYSGKNSMIMTSLLLNIPMFRSINNRLSIAEKSIGGLEEDNKYIKSSIESLEKSVQRLQVEFDKQQKEIVEMKIREKKNEELRLLNERMMLMMKDPLMFAFKKGVNIDSEEFDNLDCYIGPCWGPDFTEKVAEALDMSIFKNKNLTKKIIELYGV